MASLFLFVCLALIIPPSVADNRPRALAWSTKTYGPDGPWHAVTVQIGEVAQSVDLFPGGFWQSNILSSSICAGNPSTCFARDAGLYNAATSESATIFPQSVGGSTRNGSFSEGGMLELFGSADLIFDSMSIQTQDPPSAKVQYLDFDMIVISEGFEVLPDGTKYAIQVGTLSLGAPNLNQIWGGVNGSLLAGGQFSQDQIPSNSLGMHIGSVAKSIPPSLYLGGYDQSKVLGQITAQKYDMHFFPIDLLDIGIGVAEGDSPFSFESKSGLFASGNSSIGVSMQVIVEPASPFIYLPKSSCDAIAANLPVKYQSNLGLYFWDTTSDEYERIISSPAYLSFTFRQNSSVTQNLTINVPFSLLNLTLAPPLVETPTQYFPCNTFDYGKSYGRPTLGRAFLQAAFLGVNWQLDGNGMWFLAQAPGPNTPSEAVVKSMGLNDAFITPSTNVWADTWKGSWTPIKASTTSDPDTKSSGTSGASQTDTSKPAQTPGSRISTGAIIGIVVAIVGAVLLSVGGFFLWRKRRRDGDYQTKGAIILEEPKQKAAIDYYGPDPQIRRGDGTPPVELPLSRRPMELPAEQGSNGRWEMASPKTRVELPG